MAEQSNRLNFVGALSLVAVLIGAIWVSANGDESVGVVILLWIGVFFGVIQYFWNLFAYGEPTMGEEFRKSGSLLHASASQAGGADAAHTAALEAENAALKRRVAAAEQKGDDSAERELQMANSRLGALKDEIAGAEARFHEREVAFKQNIHELQEEIGGLNKDADKRTKVVSDARAEMEELRPYVGILIEDIPRKEKRERNLVGVRIQSVKPDTPAASCGFEDGDIIERMNSVDMNSSDDVMKNLASRKPGDRCSFLVRKTNDTFTNIVMEVGHKELDNEAVNKLRRLASGLIRANDLTEA